MRGGMQHLLQPRMQLLMSYRDTTFDFLEWKCVFTVAVIGYDIVIMYQLEYASLPVYIACTLSVQNGHPMFELL